MIPWIKSASFKCGCGDVVFYDKTITKRAPRVCTRCKLDRVAKRNLAARERLKAQTAEISGRDLELYVIRTHEEVGRIMGISPEAVRKIERAALAKVRRALEAGNKKVFTP